MCELCPHPRPCPRCEGVELQLSPRGSSPGWWDLLSGAAPAMETHVGLWSSEISTGSAPERHILLQLCPCQPELCSSRNSGILRVEGDRTPQALPQSPVRGCWKRSRREQEGWDCCWLLSVPCVTSLRDKGGWQKAETRARSCSQHPGAWQPSGIPSVAPRRSGDGSGS